MKWKNSTYITLSWVLYLSFFRGFIAIFAGYIVNQVIMSLALIMTFIPLLGLFIPNKSILKNSVPIATIFWIITVFSNHIILKIIFIFLGMSFTLKSLKQNLLLQSLTIKEIGLISGSIILIDYLLRSPNQGQDIIFHSTLLGKIVSIAIMFGILIMELQFYIHSRTGSEITITSQEKTITRNNKIIITFFLSNLSLFLTTIIYLVDYSSAGTFVISHKINQNQSLVFLSMVLIVLVIINYMIPFSQLFAVTSNKIPISSLLIIFGIGLTFSTYNYPWYGLTRIFWGLGIFLLILFIRINLIIIYQSNVDVKNIYAVIAIILSHSIVILIIFQGLTTESYYIIPASSLFLGLIAASSVLIFTSNIPKRIPISSSFYLLKGKVIVLFIIILISLSPFIPSNSILQPISPQDEIKVMTYNLHFGIGVNGLDNLDRVIEIISVIQPTLLALQEITFSSATNAHGNMFSYLKEKLEHLGYKYSYFSQGGKYQVRNVIFSLTPIIEAQTILLIPRVVYERTAIEVLVELNGKPTYVYATHLTHVGEQQSNPDRVIQIQNLMKIIKSRLNTHPVVFLGDFNSEPEWNEILLIKNYLNDTWEVNNITSDLFQGYTWPSPQPNQRIDYIFINSYFKVNECNLLESQVSDHFPVYCTLHLL